MEILIWTNCVKGIESECCGKVKQEVFIFISMVLTKVLLLPAYLPRCGVW